MWCFKSVTPENFDTDHNIIVVLWIWKIDSWERGFPSGAAARNFCVYVGYIVTVVVTACADLYDK